MRPQNLPTPLTSFVGREREIAEVRRLLTHTRLLTLTGTGGVGKTRLGHELAARLLDPAVDARGSQSGAGYYGGIWLVELAALSDETLVPRAVATVLGVREEAGRPLAASLAEALRNEHLLLLLDNCEHLVQACATLAEPLLRACPTLQILATSREPLGVAGETTFQVPTLALSPCPDSLTGSTNDVSATAPADPPFTHTWTGSRRPGSPGVSEAAGFFAARAQAAQPSFRLTDRNAEAVEQICRHLDGLPLAIELAAARIACLSPAQIAARLDKRFHLLTGGDRTALPRHRTLRALVDWSHDLLDDGERTLLRRLAVFTGGWSLEAAESVCAGEDLESDEILNVLSRLVAKCLVLTRMHGDEARYGFLESIREYATERLRDADEEITLRARHRDWFMAFAEQSEPELHGPHSTLRVSRLERDRENVRVALGWCIERRDAEAGLRLGGALVCFWSVHGPNREMRGVLAELLTLPVAQDCSAPIWAARMNVLTAVGELAMTQGECVVAEAYFEEALVIGRQLGDHRSLGIALFWLGYLARFRGDYPTAHRLYEESNQVFEALDDTYWLARTRHAQGITAYFQGDLAAARALYEASLALSMGLREEIGVMIAQNELGEVALLSGDLDMAQSLQRASLKTAHKVGDNERIAMVLAALAGVAAAQDRPRRAVRLVTAAMALNEATGQRNSPAWYALVERWLEPAYRALSAEARTAGQAAGRAMSIDEAVEHALAQDDLVDDEARAPDAALGDAGLAPDGVFDTERSGGTPAAAEPELRIAPGPRAAHPTSMVTRRELEVAELIARGLTNRQIAGELVIAEGTVANHVKNILARLGLDTRLQIAAWTIERGLHLH